MGTQTHLPATPKIKFLVGFQSLYFENVGKCKILMRIEKKLPEYPYFWGRRPPLISR